MSNFGCVDLSEWKLRLCGNRYHSLVESRAFESIVEALTRNIQLMFLRKQRLKTDASYHRVNIVLKVDRDALDLFHNSRCGYRAQYYLSTELGEKANAYAVRALWTRIKERVPTSPKSTCPWDWVEMSLTDRQAKVWIHQGPWFRQNRKSEQNLLVDRWARKLTNSDPERRKKAIWAMLTPSGEERLDIKGGFITKEGQPLQEILKRSRSEEISCLGFT